MKISWIIGKNEWAFKFSAETLSKHLPEFEHTFNEKQADVIILMCPTSYSEDLKGIIILKADSLRAYGL